jgi:AcrR family transcriptional regulator
MRKDSRRRPDSLTRQRIIDAAIELLDMAGDRGLTFQALAARLNTGAGAIYHHVANRADLLIAACDAVVETVLASTSEGSPVSEIRGVSLALFDAVDNRPWIATALARAPGSMPSVRIIERVGQQVREIGIDPALEWSVVAALLNYALGVGGQNAANAEMARGLGLDRERFLRSMAQDWSNLDAGSFQFTRSIAAQLPAHDDRVDFLTGLDLILSGISKFAAGQGLAGQSCL